MKLKQSEEDIVYAKELSYIGYFVGFSYSFSYGVAANVSLLSAKDNHRAVFYCNLSDIISIKVYNNIINPKLKKGRKLRI